MSDHEGASLDLSRIAQDMQIRRVQVEAVVSLLDEGNTVPFITRYRKERTGGLNEEAIRQIQKRVGQQRQLAERKQTILKSIQAQGKLTDELRAAILAAETTRRLEDLYLPFKPKKRTLATVARERGLEPLALAIWGKDPAVANLQELLPTFVNPEKGLPTPEEVLAGAGHILAELMAETAEVRHAARKVLWETGKLTTAKNENLPEGQGLEYKDYFQFAEPVRHIPPHRILAINRGEKEGALKARIEHHAEQLHQAVQGKLPLTDHPHADLLRAVAQDALQRLLLPSLEKEIRRELTDEAEEHAVQVFTRNLRSLLLQPPIRGQRVLAIDPAFRTGCKLAVLDEIGNLLEDGVIHPFAPPPRRDFKRKGKKDQPEPNLSPNPLSGSERGQGVRLPAAVAVGQPEATTGRRAAATEPTPEAIATESSATTTIPAPEPSTGSGAEAPNASAPAAGVDAQASPATDPAHTPAPVVEPPAAKRNEAKARLEELVRKHRATLIAIGNGTACRETEELVSEVIAEKLPELAYVIVNEAGASHYSVSPIGREEFPNQDATLRGTISIGRRLQDPLSELVKIDPQNVGVGLYQHDLSARRLKESLEAVMESCVNQVGVDLNTASVPLLRMVSGLNQLSARALVDHRKEHGPFKNREQIKQITGVGEATFTQAAGFLRIIGGDNPLDNTWIHPESYPAAQRLLDQIGMGPDALLGGERSAALREKLPQLPVEDTARQLSLGVPTLHDIVDSLLRPGRDPREDLPRPIFKKGILKLEDLQPGMELKGTVLNVVDFGAFVDVGLKDSGLVHISQLAPRFIKSPYEVASVGDVVSVWVLNVDQERRRVSLTMIKPGTERRPPERKSHPPRRGRPARAEAQGGRREGASTAQAAAAPAPAGQTATAAPHRGGRPQGHGRRPPPRQQHGHGRHQHQRQPQQARTYQAPRRERPKPKLSESALQGAEPLRTFAELKALYEAKRTQETPAPVQETAVAVETRPAETPVDTTPKTPEEA